MRKTSTPSTCADSLVTTTLATRATLTKTAMSTYAPAIAAQLGMVAYLHVCLHSQIMSRTDDVINVSGHRICTGSIEEVILQIPEVVECAVVRFSIHSEPLWC